MPPDLGATPLGVSCAPRSRHLEKVEVTVTQSCPTLCDPMDYSPPQSSVHGLFRQENWSGLPFPSPGDLPDPGIELGSPLL